VCYFQHKIGHRKRKHATELIKNEKCVGDNRNDTEYHKINISITFTQL